ncbi:hypothetical protein [Bradyrhizobium canariense]|uniref:hypothetical protein n=1 Tax=Bradyrhizobium canariense TaxID=255045 RepID=UPI0035DBCB1D
MTRPVLSVRLSWLLKGGSNEDTEQAQAGNGVWDRHWQEPFPRLGLDAAGMPIQKATFRRDTLLQFFERAGPALVGMEACSGSQWLARKIAAMGHTVRIIPAQFLKPYVKSNKNDIIDAAAIAEAVTRPRCASSS